MMASDSTAMTQGLRNQDFVAPFRVHALSVDPARGTVSGTGDVKRLEPKVMAVLAYLVEHHERVVTKDELLEAVWPDTVVDEVALARSISEIRRVLEDDARSPRLIQTFPKRGYQWIGPVDRPGEPRHLPRWSAVGFLAVVISSGWWLASRQPEPDGAKVRSRAIAVLPFENLSDDPDSGYFADGITEDVITQLSKVDELRVISRTSVMTYRGKSMSIPDIARELAVATILEGSVRVEGDRVRIVAQLVDTTSDSHIWAETYDRELKDIFDVQREVAARISSALSAELSLEERGRLEFSPTADPIAYDTYLRARAFYQRADAASIANAVELFQTALARDPDFALGYAGLADAYARRMTQRTDFESAERGIAAATKALALDPSLPEAHKALGHAYAVLGRQGEAARAYEEALELRPNYADALNNLAIVYGEIGAWDKAFQTFARMLPLEPNEPAKRSNLGWALVLLEMDREASLWLHHALERQPFLYDANRGLAELDLHAGRLEDVRLRMTRQLSVDGECHGCLEMLGYVAQREGRDGEAKRFFERAIAVPGDATVPRLRLGYLHRKAGRLEEAERWLAEAESVPRFAIENGSEWWGPRWALAAAASVRGDTDEALFRYREAVRAGRRYYRWDLTDPLFENVRTDPRFIELLAEMNRSVIAMRSRLGEIPLPRVATSR